MGSKGQRMEFFPAARVRLLEWGRGLWQRTISIHPGGIQARLIALIVLALLPLLLLLAWIFQQRYEVRRTMALQTELEVARGIAMTFATYTEGLHQQNFSVGEAILASMQDEPQKITHLLHNVVEHSPAIRNLSWAAPDGTVIASSLPELEGRDLSVRSYFKEVLAGKAWSIGDLTNQGIVTNAPTIALATGIRDENGVLQGLIVAGMEPDRLNEIVLTQQRPDGGVYAIFDRKGAVVYRSGTRLTWEQRSSWLSGDSLLYDALRTGEEQTGLRTLDVPGGEWVSARVPVSEIGYVVGAGRPVELAFEPVLGSLLREALLALLIWCMAFLFALSIAGTISGPLHVLEQDALSMGTGRFEPRIDPKAPSEVRSLRKTVERMATALIQRADALRESESTLRESEARFRVLFHNRHSPMLLIDPGTGQIVDANPAACEFYGWSRDIMLGMKITQINQLAANVTHEEMRQAQTSGTSKQFHFQHRLASGEIRDVEVNSGPIHINGQDYLFSIIHDITERRLAEREMRERNEGLALLSEAAQDLLGGGDPRATLSRLYPRLSELLHLDCYFHYILSDDGTYLSLIGHSEISPQHQEIVQRLKIGETICGRAAQLREPVIVNDVQQSEAPDANLIRSMGITAYACHPLIVQNHLVGTLSFGSRARTSFDPQSIQLMRTIANLLAAALYRRHAEDRLQVYARKLEESNAELQSFAFIASHDLQEPLRKVESFGGLLLKESSGLDDQQRDYLERMRQAAGRMRSMVMDLLELSRISTKGKPFEPVDLNEIIREVLSDLEMQMLQTGGKVHLEPLPKIDGDPTQMHQLMLNLVSNALKYHRPGVTPEVTVTAKALSANRVQIRVADNGIGFEPSQTERIFQPFQRLVGRSEYAGTGIGLAICRKIIERHQGSITAEPVPGQGTLFVVELPARQPKEKK